MTVISRIRTFGADETGAVTVDWVVLTAAIVGLGMVVMTTLSTPLQTTTGGIADDIESAADF